MCEQYLLLILDNDIHEEYETFIKKKNARLDQQIPNEIYTRLDIPARERFQKHRDLESFNTSRWDVTENLPIDNARICPFQNFDEYSGIFYRQFVLINEMSFFFKYFLAW